MQEKIDRMKLVKEKIKAEDAVHEMQTEGIRRRVFEFLKNTRGYSEEDIEIDARHEVEVSDAGSVTSVDFIISIKGKRLIAIKCSPSELESRERHILAFSRVVSPYQIPYSVITNGEDARILDTVSGRLISEGISSLPSKEELLGKIKDIEFRQYPPERLEREKRILLAFDAISCPMDI